MQRFRISDKEISASDNAVIELRDDLDLRFCIEIDQHVTTEHDVEIRHTAHTRLVEQIHVVELHKFPDIVVHDEASVLGMKIFIKIQFRHIADGIFAVHTLPRDIQNGRTDIGSDYLKFQ